MSLRTRLKQLGALLEPSGPQFCRAGQARETAARLLEVMADLLQTVPPATPLATVLEQILRALPAGAFGRAELDRLAEQATARDAHPCVRVQSIVAAQAIRSLAGVLTAESSRRKDNGLLPARRLLNFVENLFPEKEGHLVTALLEREDHWEEEAPLIHLLWPSEKWSKQPSPRLRNRLHQLQHSANERLLLYDGPAWKITRPLAGLLQIRMLWREV